MSHNNEYIIIIPSLLRMWSDLVEVLDPDISTVLDNTATTINVTYLPLP